MIFEKNLKIIKKRWPHLTERCAGDFCGDERPCGELVVSGKKITVRLPDSNERFLHSPIDPIREAGRWIENQAWENDVVIVLGFGFGYHIKAALGEKKIKRLIACEICPLFFKQVINQVDLTTIFQDSRFELALGGYEEIKKYFQGPASFEKAALWRYMPAVNLCPEEYEAIESYLNQRMAEAKGFNRPYDGLGPLGLHHGVSLLMQDIIK
jgi:hypothetical protein